MAQPQPAQKFTRQEYYERERLANHKSQFYAGEIFAMAGGSVRHSRISTNLTISLGLRLQNGNCVPYNSDLRVAILASGLITYPDASVFCGKLEFDPSDKRKETVVNPTVVFEVLSESTEAYDRGTKSGHYRRIPALKAFVHISQNEPQVEHYRRQSDHSWVMTEVNGLDAVLQLPALGIELPLSELYAGVEFDDPPRLNVVREG